MAKYEEDEHSVGGFFLSSETYHRYYRSCFPTEVGSACECFFGTKATERTISTRLVLVSVVCSPMKSIRANRILADRILMLHILMIRIPANHTTLTRAIPIRLIRILLTPMTADPILLRE